MSDGGVSLDPPERTMGRRWLAVAGAALVTGASAAQVVVPAAETSPASIAGIAPSYGGCGRRQRREKDHLRQGGGGEPSTRGGQQFGVAPRSTPRGRAPASARMNAPAQVAATRRHSPGACRPGVDASMMDRVVAGRA
jgi:hypothetical protein